MFNIYAQDMSHSSESFLPKVASESRESRYDGFPNRAAQTAGRGPLLQKKTIQKPEEQLSIHRDVMRPCDHPAIRCAPCHATSPISDPGGRLAGRCEVGRRRDEG